MKILRFAFVIGSFSCAIGLLMVMFLSLSSVVSAHASSSTIINGEKVAVVEGWRTLADMQLGRGDTGVVAMNTKIHVIGGYYSPGYGYSDAHDIYDPQTNTWVYLWGFPQPRSDMVVTAVGDNIYAIGGWNIDQGGVQGYNHMYDPTLETWITKTAMITPVSDAGWVVISDTIYVIGGFDGVTATRHVQLYDTVLDTWSSGTPMSTPRTALGAEFVNGLVYALGGTSNINDVEIYDPNADLWLNGTPLPETRYSFATAKRNGQIYVIGGTTSEISPIAKDTTYVLDPISGTWSIDAAMPTARIDIGAALLDDIIYVIGGTGEAGAGTANEAYGIFDVISTTTNIVSVTPNPSQSFQPVTIGFLVTSTFDVPTGVVTVTTGQGANLCSGQLVDGSGSCEALFTTPGTYSLTATYSGDDFHYGSSDTDSHTVNKADTTTFLIDAKPEPSLIDQPVTFTYEVTSTYGMPVGTITVTTDQGANLCFGQLVDGSGSCEALFTSPGSYTITATYSGDDFHYGSSDIGNHTVSKAETTTLLTGAEPEPSLIGQPVMFTFEVTSTYGSPVGVVTVTTGQDTNLCFGHLVDGSGSCEALFTSPGSYTITTTYNGDDFHYSSSDTGNHTVSKAETITLLTGAQPEPSLVGQPVMFTFEVTSTYGIPVGEVTVTSASNQGNCTGQLTAGIGTCEIIFNERGEYTVTATYQGDVTFESSSDDLLHQVQEFFGIFIPSIYNGR